jgi:molybdate transport system substrate-binding protein
VVVSAASSLAEVVSALATAYRAVDSTVTITTNFGSSGTLAQQIRQGAGVDLYLSASDREMDLLEREGLIEPGTRRVLASNDLVLVVPPGEGRVRGIEDLAGEGVQRVAIGAPASVPAGEYAREMLATLGLWERVAPRAVLASNVRQALTYVERGEVDAALVYRTDALRSPGVVVVATAPPGSHRPIRYPAARVAAGANRDDALRFLDFIAGPAGEARFRALGFGPRRGS